MLKSTLWGLLRIMFWLNIHIWSKVERFKERKKRLIGEKKISRSMGSRKGSGGVVRKREGRGDSRERDGRRRGGVCEGEGWSGGVGPCENWRWIWSIGDVQMSVLNEKGVTHTFSSPLLPPYKHKVCWTSLTLKSKTNISFTIQTQLETHFSFSLIVLTLAA